MRLIAFRGKINTPVSGNAELQSLRILAAFASWLGREGVKPVSRDANRYTFRAGYGARFAYTNFDFIRSITSGEISISQAGNQHFIVYRIYFDELALVSFGACAIIGIMTRGAYLMVLLVGWLCVFFIIAFVTIIRFRRFLLSCLKQANA